MKAEELIAALQIIVKRKGNLTIHVLIGSVEGIATSVDINRGSYEKEYITISC